MTRPNTPSNIIVELRLDKCDGCEEQPCTDVAPEIFVEVDERVRLVGFGGILAVTQPRGPKDYALRQKTIIDGDYADDAEKASDVCPNDAIRIET